jgi:hypothetical protein
MVRGVDLTSVDRKPTKLTKKLKRGSKNKPKAVVAAAAPAAPKGKAE